VVYCGGLYYNKVVTAGPLAILLVLIPRRGLLSIIKQTFYEF
jgi:hypothetical protein